MSTPASIGEPFLLSSYASPLPKGKAQPSCLYATYVEKSKSKGSGSGAGYVTVAAPADGVHVLDVSALHPVISHTLGPSTIFAAPALTTVSSSTSVFTTYAAVSSSSMLPAAGLSSSSSSSGAEANRTLCSWSEDLSSSLAERAQQNQKMKSAIMSHAIQALHSTSSLEERILVLGPTGQVSLVDSELNLKASWCPSPSSSSSSTTKTSASLLKTFSFDRKSCTFLPSGLAPGAGMVLVLILSSAESISLQALFSNAGNDELTLVGDCTLPFGHDQISSISLSASGCFSVLLKSQIWHTYLFSPSSDSSSSLRTISLSPAFTLSPTLKAPTLLALTSSHVLLASPTVSPSPSEIAILLWDLQYGVLLAEAAFPLKEKELFRLELVHGDSQQAVLVLSPSKSKPGSGVRLSLGGEAAESSAKSPFRASVLVIPFSVPAQSTIAAAMGKGTAGKRWISPTSAAASASGTAGKETSSDPDQQEKVTLLARMRGGMEQGRVQAADAAFFEWEKRAKERLEVEDAAVGEVEGENDDGENKEEKGKSTEKKKLAPRLPALGYPFVKDLLAIALPTPQQGKPPVPCSDAIVRYLLERKAVSSGMVEGGLVRALRIREDWNLIQLSLQTVLDLPETELVSCLYAVLAVHQQQAKSSAQKPEGETADKDAIDIDPSPQQPQSQLQPQQRTPAPTSIPSLPTFLAALVAYPTSTPALRQALRVHLKQPADVTAVLRVLDGWVRRWNDKGMRFGVGKDGGEVKVGKSRKKVGKREEGLPALDQITTFLQTLLDASFLLLLSHKPAHKVLKHLSTVLEPEIALLEIGEQLRGPLEPFANAHTRALKEKERKKTRGGKDPQQQGDWRQRRKQAHAQAGLAVGAYQLEELIL